MDAEQKKKIIEALQKCGANLPCSRCGNQTFTLIDGYFNQTVQPQLNNSLMIGGPSVPSVGVVCNKCGLISHHAVGVLGLMPTPDNKNESEPQTTK